MNSWDPELLKLDSASKEYHSPNLGWYMSDSDYPQNRGGMMLVVQVSDSTGICGTRVDFEPHIESFESRLNKLESEINRLKSIFYNEEPEEVQIRDIPYEQAKKEIEIYFSEHHGENIDAADLQKTLGIEIMLAIDILDELENEGKIKSS